MQKTAFAVFKWTVYGLLVLNSYLFLRTEDTITGFLDSAAWLVLLGVMEYESSSLDRDYDSDRERWIIVGLNLFAYAVIVYSCWSYFNEARWLDFVNASAWLGVCGVLLWQMYSPGEYEGAEYRIVTAIKTLLYLVLIGCALAWTIEADKPLDAVDAWLWLACFAVIELNVFGFDHAAEPGAVTARDDEAGRGA